MLRVYLGGSMRGWDTILMRNEDLRAIGVDVVSTWAAAPKDRPAVVAAKTDFFELLAADVVVIDTTVESSSGGYHSEIGAALAAGKTLAIYGATTNVFAELAQKHFTRWSDVLAWLRCLAEVRRVCG